MPPSVTCLTGGVISEYQVNEPGTLATLRHYVGQWARCLKLGLSTLKEFELNVQILLPSIALCWMPGAKVFSSGSCQ